MVERTTSLLLEELERLVVAIGEIEEAEVGGDVEGRLEELECCKANQGGNRRCSKRPYHRIPPPLPDHFVGPDVEVPGGGRCGDRSGEGRQDDRRPVGAPAAHRA